MAMYPSIARGSQANVFKGMAQGASLGNQMRNRNALVDSRVKTNSITNKRNTQLIDDEKRIKRYEIIRAAQEINDPEKKRLMLKDNEGAFVEDDNDRVEFQSMLNSDTATFNDSLDRLFLAVKPPNEMSKYGAVQTLSKNGQNISGQVDQRGNVRELQGYGPELDQEAETFGDFQDIPGFTGARGQKSKKTGKFANVQTPGSKGSTFKTSKGLRTEFVAQSKDFVKVRDSFRRIIASSQDPSAAGDLALIFNYMKMLDPGSVVRESEFATAANSASVPDRIRAQYNRVLAGERLAANTRDDFTNRSKQLYQSQLQGQDQLKDTYTGLASRFDLDPKNVVIQYGVGEDELDKIPSFNSSDEIAQPKSAEDFNALPSGAEYISPADGKKYRKQ